MWQFGAFGLFVLCFAFWIGDLFNSRTKGIISGLLAASVLYIIGYLSGVIPTDQPAALGLGAMIGSYGQMIIVVNLGTMVSLNDLLKQWKTVLTCLVSLAVMVFAVGALGTMLFGREIGLLAVAPISGGAVASAMVAETATNAGRADLAALAMLFNVLQLLFGVPASSFLLKKYCTKMAARGLTGLQKEQESGNLRVNLRILKPVPDSCNTKYLILAKLSLIAFFAAAFSQATSNVLPAAIAALLLGVILTEIGFLDRKSLQKSNFYDFFMFAFMAYLVSAFSSLTIERLISFLVPLLVLLLTGVVSLAAGAAVMGKALHMDWALAASLGPSAMFGYPFSQFICEDVVREMHLPGSESEQLLQDIMPKMVIAGFVTVTIASVFIAGIIAPFIFA